MNREKLLRKYKNLPQYKECSEEELLKIVDKKIELDNYISSLTYCLDDEKEFAKNQLENYLEESFFEHFSEKDTLLQLIGLEVIAERMKKFLKTEAEKTNLSIPLQMVEQITNVNKQILDLKKLLGLIKEEKTQNNALNEWEKLKTKALAYYKENAGSNVCRCPYCKKLFMILKDMRGFFTEKMPWFKRTILYNKPLYELYHTKIISLKKMAEILGVNEDYVTYIYENIYLNEKKQ